jgi:hypothetical protein
MSAAFPKRDHCVKLPGISFSIKAKHKRLTRIFEIHTYINTLNYGYPIPMNTNLQTLRTPQTNHKG